MDLRERPAPEGDVRDLSPGEVPSTVDTVCLLPIKFSFALQFAARLHSLLFSEIAPRLNATPYMPVFMLVLLHIRASRGGRTRREQSCGFAESVDRPAMKEEFTYALRGSTESLYWKSQMILTRRSLLQVLGIGSAAALLPSAGAHGAKHDDADTRTATSSQATQLERFLKAHGIRPALLARDAGYSRPHLLRLRFGRMYPSLVCIAALVISARRITGERISPQALFEVPDIRSAWRDTRRNLEQHERSSHDGARPKSSGASTHQGRASVNHDQRRSPA